MGLKFSLCTEVNIVDVSSGLLWLHSLYKPMSNQPNSVLHGNLTFFSDPQHYQMPLYACCQPDGSRLLLYLLYEAHDHWGMHASHDSTLLQSACQTHL